MVQKYYCTKPLRNQERNTSSSILTVYCAQNNATEVQMHFWTTIDINILFEKGSGHSTGSCGIFFLLFFIHIVTA